MSELDSFSRRVETHLTRAERRLEQHQRDRQQQNSGLAERHHQYHELAARLVRTILRPRVERLLHYFPDGELTGPNRAVGERCIVRWPHTRRFPAMVELDLGLGHDGPVEHLLAWYDVRIRPIFMRFEHSDQVTFSLARVDETKLVDWIEDKLLMFVETYLRLEYVDFYQSSVLTTDPVSGARFSKLSAAAEAEHAGRRYYFVNEENRAQFSLTPENFVGGSPTG